jgi:hypothetical protein
LARIISPDEQLNRGDFRSGQCTRTELIGT